MTEPETELELNEAVEPDRADRADLTPGTTAFDRARARGKIVMKPARSADGKSIRTSDGQTYDITNKGGTIVNTCKPPRMSKKQRRLWRAEQLAEAEL